MKTSASTVGLGSAVSITAQYSKSLSAPYRIKIFNLTTGRLIKTCSQGDACVASVTNYRAATSRFGAFLTTESGTEPVGGASDDQWVVWTSRSTRVNLTYDCATRKFTANSTSTGLTFDFVSIYDEQGIRRCVGASGCEYATTSGRAVAFIGGDTMAYPPAPIQATSGFVWVPLCDPQ